MEAMIKKFQEKIRKTKEEMSQWDELQSHLISQFTNASYKIERLEVHRDGIQLVRGSSKQAIKKQLQHKTGLKPSLADCSDGLMLLHKIHLSDANDLGALHQILVDQPTIPREEVTNIFEIILAEGLW